MLFERPLVRSHGSCTDRFMLREAIARHGLWVLGFLQASLWPVPGLLGFLKVRVTHTVFLLEESQICQRLVSLDRVPTCNTRVPKHQKSTHLRFPRSRPHPIRPARESCRQGGVAWIREQASSGHEWRRVCVCVCSSCAWLKRDAELKAPPRTLTWNLKTGIYFWLRRASDSPF